MSLRGSKRSSGVRGEEAGPSKRRRMDAEDPLWSLRPVTDLKMSSIYNRNAPEAPAELFRKDLISAMKLPDSEPLGSSDYWVITDTWKQDWERGVQVPVNPDSLPAPKVKIIENPMPPDFQEFKLPRDKYIHLARDAHYQSEKHLLSSTPARAEAACNYDLDATDTAWLRLLNAERARAGALSVTEDQLEKVIEELEVRTWDKIQSIMKSEEGLGIEYDENVICDVCRSPDSEDGNEMVFCDSCNICVHQACYGITVIPDGQWLCRPCGDGVRPTCVLCPNLGGAMKCTPTSHKWAHVSCVLWIPEVSIGCAEKMEPITKISAIPASRWSLVCVLCRERKGACIQCSVKTCKTAYHVTCAFKHGLEMRAIIEDENADDGVKLRSYCQKHSVNKKDKCPGSGSEEEEVKRKRRKDMTSEEKTQARAARLHEIEREFDRHVSVKDISSHLLDVDQDSINYIYNYWKLKRRAGHNRPLLPPKSDDSELLTHRQEQADLDKMKMFVQLRQDLERVRNLCYMVSRREKLSRSFFRMREQTFHKQCIILEGDPNLSAQERAAIIQVNHGPTIYDRFYSHPDTLANLQLDFKEILARIAPEAASDSEDDKQNDHNGGVKGKKANPYKKHYVNGSRRSGSMYSGLSSEESAPEISRTSRYRGRAIGSSTEEDVKKPGSPKKKVSPKTKGKKSPLKNEKKKKKVPTSKAVVDSSSEEESLKSRLKKDKSRSKTLQQLEKEMTDGKFGDTGSESDELMPIRHTRNSKFPIDIYSDSSEDRSAEESATKKDDKSKTAKSKSDKNKPYKSPSDSQQSLPRTKGAMKEFIPSQPEKKTAVVEEKPSPKKRGRKPSNKDKKVSEKVISDDEAKNKENIKLAKQKDHPTDLIVPQRQAAKKASENMRSTTTAVGKKEEPIADKQNDSDDAKSKPKYKPPKDEKKEVREKEVIPAKVGRKKSSKDLDKETIAYVPQRQAAKKAAAHIKSGLGTKLPVVECPDAEKKKDGEKTELTKSSPKKEEAKGIKSPQNSSSSSSNSSSSSYSSSSSSEQEEQEKPSIKPTVKAREIKPARPPSLFSPPGTRPTVDLPFLDKVSRPLSSTSASSDSESSQASRNSGSSSPSPKRPRRRRKGKSLSTDASPRKAPDKKFKTSERRSECGVPSPSAEGEEPSRSNHPHAATRARTRSTTASGNMPYKSDARQRKPSKDDTAYTYTPNKNSKEGGQSSELSTAERKMDKAIKDELKEETTFLDILKNEPKTNKSSKTIKRGSIDGIDRIKTPDVDINKSSPKKSVDLKHKSVSSRRMSVKDQKESFSPVKSSDIAKKERRLSRHDAEQLSSSERNKMSPFKKLTFDKHNISDLLNSPSGVREKSPVPLDDDFSETDKHWLSKAPSPVIHPPPVEKLGSHEKYMTEDSDSTEKSSLKMIAKIQANLNENTMIKSPKTPMDARTIMMDPMDLENPMSRNVRKRSTYDSEKKFITQDASHMQGIEISKSAKIPSTNNPCPNRSIFPPPSKENLYDIDMMSVEDGYIHHEDTIKTFTPETLFKGNSKEQGVQETLPESLFKSDSKEQGVQETLDLVDRLKRQLHSKKIPTENSAQEEPSAVNDDKENRDEDNNHNEHDLIPTLSKSAFDFDHRSNKDYHSTVNTSSEDQTRDVCLDNDRPIAMTSNDRWSEHPMSQNDRSDRNYDNHLYSEECKEPVAMQADTRSISEVGDTISLSKQSDDSQSLSVVDHSVHSNDQELTQDNQNYDNNNSLIHSDCATISSPYVSQDSKWRESKITTRRSSASSTNSEGSVCSRKIDMKSSMNSCDSHQGNVMPEIDHYPPISAYSRTVESNMPMNQYSYLPETSPFLTSMSLPIFAPGACAPSQLPLPSPGPGHYPPGISFPTAPLLQPMPKPAFPTLGAAFTTSSQNLALTTAMIAPPTPKPSDSPRDEIDVTGSDKFSVHVVSSPSISVDSYNDSNNARPATKMSNDSNETVTSLHPQESKSPPKPKSTPKFPGKSPGKSPRFSPKQSEPKGTKRANNRSNRSQRGRGRSKSRAQGMHGYHVDYMGNSIQSKLVGTVYDFDEEIANDGVDLKALRERRKSIDVRDDRKSEHSYKEVSHVPSVVSPQQSSKKTPQAELKEPKPPTPSKVPEQDNASPSAKGAGFSSVQPLLPGPVDMRTYQPFEKPPPPVEDAYNSHLLAFESGTADQQLAEIDEEVEKQLHSALMASNPVAGSPAPPSAPIPELPKETITPQLPRVSLSDSRNQLKVKIKGPFLDANYSASSVQPVAPQPPAPVMDYSFNMLGGSSSAGTPMMSGSTNLRRMRKKELLRQYWTQDMNMDDPANASTMGIAPLPVAPSTLARAVITIPKAVASMTSIPTREDYKYDSPVEKKKRKTTSGLSRELRHLEVSMNDEMDPADNNKSFTSSASLALKRRGRVPNKPSASNVTSPLAPKLKIKIGSNIVQQVNEEPSGFQDKPLKKRFPSIPKPSLEDLRRDSMKYRRMVMADFEEHEKPKKSKPTKSEKRKKKKDKKAEREKLQVVNRESESATKLIIKIKRTKEEDAESRASVSGVAGPAPEPAVDPFVYDPSAPDPLAIDSPALGDSYAASRKIRTAKVTPIRLKLSRSSQGSGYVMKDALGERSSDAPPVPPSDKNCDVR